MIRLYIIFIVLAAAVSLYALFDAATSDRDRVRGVSKPAWILLILAVPLIGGLLWLFVGKERAGAKAGVFMPHGERKEAISDTDLMLRKMMQQQDSDRRIRDLEQRLRELEEEDRAHPQAPPGDQQKGDADDEPENDGYPRR